MALVIFRTRKGQNEFEFKEKIEQYWTFYEIVRLVLYFNRVFDLYELMNVKYFIIIIIII